METLSAAAPSTLGDRIAIADDVCVRFVSRDEWEAAAFVLVEVDRELSEAQLAAYADGLAQTGLSNLKQTLIFDRRVRVRLLPGEVEIGRRLVASEARVRELEAERDEANRRAESFRKLLAARPPAKPSAVTEGA